LDTFRLQISQNLLKFTENYFGHIEELLILVFSIEVSNYKYYIYYLDIIFVFYILYIYI